MKRMIVLLAVILLPVSIQARAAPTEPDCATRPAWCKPGYVCLPTSCATDTAAQLLYLTAERNSFADRLKSAKGRRLHFDLTCGASGTLVIEDNEIDFPAGPGCAAGLAIRIW